MSDVVNKIAKRKKEITEIQINIESFELELGQLSLREESWDSDDSKRSEVLENWIKEEKEKLENLLFDGMPYRMVGRARHEHQSINWKSFEFTPFSEDKNRPVSLFNRLVSQLTEKIVELLESDNEVMLRSDYVDFLQAEVTRLKSTWDDLYIVGTSLPIRGLGIGDPEPFEASRCRQDFNYVLCFSYADSILVDIPRLKKLENGPRKIGYAIPNPKNVRVFNLSDMIPKG